MKNSNANNRQEVKNEVLTHKMILAINKNYKEQSIFRVVDFLNKQKEVIQANNNEKLTIDMLKNLCPDYFKMNSKDKDGNLIIIDRKVFNPYNFLKALSKKANNK